MGPIRINIELNHRSKLQACRWFQKRTIFYFKSVNLYIPIISRLKLLSHFYEAVLDVSTSFVKLAGSLIARSARIFRSIATPLLVRPAMNLL
jgi:hypothetical protein